MSLQRTALLLLSLVCGATGCSLIENAAHTLVLDPIHFCTYPDRYFAHHRHLQMADTTWVRIVQANPSESYSMDYGYGFRDGFADYLDAGPGNIPALPPRRYWTGRYQSPQGHQAILDWYDGFAHGARVAAASGYRQFVTLPSYYSPTFVPEAHSLPVVEPSDVEAIPTPLPETSPDGRTGHIEPWGQVSTTPEGRKTAKSSVLTLHAERPVSGVLPRGESAR
jgi:hypothetical protein